MMQPKPRVLVDSCVIIEAFRVKCWKALCRHFDVETVECCVVECCTGDPLTPGRVPIQRDELLKGLAHVHAVTNEMIASLAIDFDDLPALDDGELHIMAWLHAHEADVIQTAISTADRAAIRATSVLKVLDRVTSLQSLGQVAGVGRKQLENLAAHYREDWLSQVRMQLNMKIL